MDLAVVFVGEVAAAWHERGPNVVQPSRLLGFDGRRELERAFGLADRLEDRVATEAGAAALGALGQDVLLLEG